MQSISARLSSGFEPQAFRSVLRQGPQFAGGSTIDGIYVDVTPTSEEILGFSNRWYDSALACPIEIEVSPGLRIRVVNHAAFLATKFEAFASRGQGEYEGDTDIEDIISVLAYCRVPRRSAAFRQIHNRPKEQGPYPRPLRSTQNGPR